MSLTLRQGGKPTGNNRLSYNDVFANKAACFDGSASASALGEKFVTVFSLFMSLDNHLSVY